MYLAKYIICAFVFVAALLFVIRTCSSTSIKSWRGILARVLLSILLLSFVGVIWYYATEENFGSEKIETGARIISSVLFLICLPDVWKDADPKYLPAPKEERAPDAEADQASANEQAGAQ